MLGPLISTVTDWSSRVKDKKRQVPSFAGSQALGLRTQNFLLPQPEALNWENEGAGFVIKPAGVHPQRQKRPSLGTGPKGPPFHNRTQIRGQEAGPKLEMTRAVVFKVTNFSA